MQAHTITQDEKNQLTDDACRQFLQRNPDYYPNAANSQKLVQFVEAQYGMTLAEYPYPVLLESWQAAYDHLKKVSWFYEREPEVEDTTAQTAEQQRALEAANADLAAAKSEEIRIARAMPLKELGTFTAGENAKFRELRDRNELPTRPTGLESRSLSTVTMGVKAQARANVALANPSLPRDGADFAKLYAVELSKLRSE